jgi:hypothetical protein
MATMAFDRSKLPETIWRWNGALLVRMYPPLKIVADPYERQVVLERLLPPSPKMVRYWRLIFWLIVAVSFGAGLVTARYVRVPGLTGAAAFMVPFMAGFLLVDAGSFALCMAIMTWRSRPKVAERLRRLGWNLCPRCAYDLRGCEPGETGEIVCPECGLRVPRLSGTAKSGAGDQE